MYKHLTQAQRYYIYVERQKGNTQKSIAQAIGVSEATVSREIRRNGGKSGSYNFIKAQEKAEVRSHRSPGNRAISDTLKWRVSELLTKEQLSPKQISGRLKKEGHEISYETIYAMIRADETGELAKHCRRKMKYDKKIHMKHETKATNIKNRVSIHERPPEADGTRFGDWEMYLIVDKDHNAILTLGLPARIIESIHTDVFYGANHEAGGATSGIYDLCCISINIKCINGAFFICRTTHTLTACSNSATL